MDWISLLSKASTTVKKYRYAFLILLLGLILMCIPQQEAETASITSESQPQEISIEEQLAQLLGKISGAGKVEVMLSMSAGPETIYQEDTDTARGSESYTDRTDTVIITNESRQQTGLIRQVIPPVYQGALIICQGGDDPAVRLAIVEAVSKLTGLGADKICVLKMK